MLVHAAIRRGRRGLQTIRKQITHCWRKGLDARALIHHPHVQILCSSVLCGTSHRETTSNLLWAWARVTPGLSRPRTSIKCMSRLVQKVAAEDSSNTVLSGAYASPSRSGELSPEFFPMDTDNRCWFAAHRATCLPITCGSPPNLLCRSIAEDEDGWVRQRARLRGGRGGRERASPRARKNSCC